jgi:hypothetical protein
MNLLREAVFSGLFDMVDARRDPYRSWFACMSVSYILHDESESKNILVDFKYSDTDDPGTSLSVFLILDDAIFFLHRIAFTLVNAAKESYDIRIVVGYLTLLCTWLYECPNAVALFLSEGSNVQFVHFIPH